MLKKILILLLVILNTLLTSKGICALDFTGEIIIYDITPIGTSEYRNCGLVDFMGKKAHFSTFRTQVLGFDDTEKIYADPDTFLPLRVVRDISMWTGDENLIEEYTPSKGSVIIKKFKDGKEVKRYTFKENYPIQNAILLPFSLRRISNLNIGWSMNACFPQKFKVKLISIEEIEVPAGKFTAYHFTSIPNKFEIWISKDEFRIPIKIKGMGGFGYTLSMKKYILKK